MKVEDLYHPIILEHNMAPHHFEKLDSVDAEQATYQVEAYNPLCGDEFAIYLYCQAGRIEKACFFGYGCAVSKAATSMLMDRLQGVRLNEAHRILIESRTIIVGTDDVSAENDALVVFRAAQSFPERLKCATLSADAMISFLNGAALQ